MEKSKNIGALWVKDSKSGNKFMSGVVEIDGEKHQIVVFENTHKKEGSNQPDYKIYPSKTPQGVPEIVGEEMLF